MVKQDRLIGRFLRYIKIPSQSKHERKFADLIKRELRTLGLKVYEDSAGKLFGGDAGNVYAFLKGKQKEAPTILFNSHLDTVIYEGEIKSHLKNNYIHSDGKTILGADDKAGAAIILEMLTLLKEKRILHGDILIVFTVAEEIGLLGAKHLDKKKLAGVDFGFALDGGHVQNLEHRAPSQYNLEAFIHGKAAHAGVHPEKGINAIKVACEAIAAMKLGRIDKETTANIGIIEGGKATNIIADKVHIKGEARSHNLKKLKRQLQHMQSTLAKSCAKHRAVLKLVTHKVYNSFSLKPSSVVIKLVKEASKLELKLKSTGGGSDANIFNAWGIPTAILGTGGSSYHTNRESLNVSQMVKAVELLVSIVKGAAK